MLNWLRKFLSYLALSSIILNILGTGVMFNVRASYNEWWNHLLQSSDTKLKSTSALNSMTWSYNDLSNTWAYNNVSTESLDFNLNFTTWALNIAWVEIAYFTGAIDNNWPVNNAAFTGSLSFTWWTLTGSIIEAGKFNLNADLSYSWAFQTGSLNFNSMENGFYDLLIKAGSGSFSTGSEVHYEFVVDKDWAYSQPAPPPPSGWGWWASFYSPLEVTFWNNWEASWTGNIFVKLTNDRNMDINWIQGFWVWFHKDFNFDISTVELNGFSWAIDRKSVV